MSNIEALILHFLFDQHPNLFFIYYFNFQATCFLSGHKTNHLTGTTCSALRVLGLATQTKGHPRVPSPPPQRCCCFTGPEPPDPLSPLSLWLLSSRRSSQEHRGGHEAGIVSPPPGVCFGSVFHLIGTAFGPRPVHPPPPPECHPRKWVGLVGTLTAPPQSGGIGESWLCKKNIPPGSLPSLPPILCMLAIRHLLGPHHSFPLICFHGDPSATQKGGRAGWGGG